MSKHEFINEVGNKIQIAVHTFLTNQGEFTKIIIIGPHSETEMTLTEHEALVLKELLHKELGV